MIFQYLDHLSEIKDFGIFSASISELARLASLEFYQSGAIDFPDLNPDIEYDEHSPEFQNALSSSIDMFKDRLIESIERNNLKTTWMHRDLTTGKIDPDDTLVHYEDFIGFLDLFGLGDPKLEYTLGDYFWSEVELATKIDDIVKNKRLVTQKIDPDEVARMVSETTLDKEKLVQIIEENFQLRWEATQTKIENETISPEKPITNRERNTFLIIIAALAKAAKIDINKPGKAGDNISNAILELGIEVDHYTIEKKLKEIPDALERRQKLKANPK